MNEWIQTAIVVIDLVVTGHEAHNSRKASQGGGNLWTAAKLILWEHLFWGVNIRLQKLTRTPTRPLASIHKVHNLSGAGIIVQEACRFLNPVHLTLPLIKASPKWLTMNRRTDEQIHDVQWLSPLDKCRRTDNLKESQSFYIWRKKTATNVCTLKAI